MRKSFAVLLSVLSLTTVLSTSTALAATQPQAEKDWTFLIYLNGKNSLDSFGPANLKQMEKVGSTDKINIVVQWASTSNNTTKRLLVQKSTDPSSVTSPTVQDMGPNVDMGNWQTLVDFVKWGVQNYPAQHYFINVWDHGSGWHQLKALGSKAKSHGFSPLDISWDDSTGNFITTKQLGQAMSEAAKIIGHKIDVYGSDACLMAMAEVADEMSDSVSYFVGSEETEPAEGWPYDVLLSKWSALGSASSADVAKILTSAYVASYEGGEYGTKDATFSAFDMSKLGALETSISSLGSQLSKLDPAARKKVVTAAGGTQSFTYPDYGDLMDFLAQIDGAQVGLKDGITAEVRNAASEFVIANADTPRYDRAKGVAIWLPSSTGTYNQYADKYKELNFDARTGWGSTLKYILQDTSRH